MLLIRVFANFSWFLSTLIKTIKFSVALKNPIIAQENYLRNLLNANKQTSYLKNFTGLKEKNSSGFIQNIPVSTYSYYETYIHDITQGKNNILSKSSVKMCSVTSGTTSAPKLIPVTNKLLSEFQNGIAPWIHFLYITYPKLFNRSFFWIISPNTTYEKTNSLTPIQFDTDSSYLNPLEKIISKQILTLPDILANINNPQNYYYALGYYMLYDKNIGLISIWNPSLLPLILESITKNRFNLISDIANGKLSLPQPEPKVKLPVRKSDKKRATEVGKYLNTTDALAVNWKEIWLGLQVISCWTDGWSENLIHKCITPYFPGVSIQGKGLLATEFFASIPFRKNSNPVLAIRSHFFEFRNTNTSQITSFKKLELNTPYELIVTTGSGFYRYATADIVEITSFVHKTPCIKFIRKNNLISDLCGEKLHNDLVYETFFKTNEKYTNFYAESLLCPYYNESQTGYYICTPISTKENIEAQQSEIEIYIDNLLQQNYHYKHCRNLNQLSCVKLQFCNNMPKKTNGYLSTHKPVVLINQTNAFKNLI